MGKQGVRASPADAGRATHEPSPDGLGHTVSVPDVAKIAKGLTVHQRDLLFFLPADGSWFEGGILHRYPPNALRGFGQSGLIVSEYDRTRMRFRLSEDGLAVREHLLGSMEKDG